MQITQNWSIKLGREKTEPSHKKRSHCVRLCQPFFFECRAARGRNFLRVEAAVCFLGNSKVEQTYPFI